MEEPYAATTAPPPQAAHQPDHTWLWDDICSSQGSHRGCVGHPSACSTSELKPQLFSLVEVWAVGKDTPFHFPSCHILEVVCGIPGDVGASTVILEGGVRSQIVEIWCRHWLQSLVLICHGTAMAFSGDKPCFVSDGDVTPHHDAAPT